MTFCQLANLQIFNEFCKINNTQPSVNHQETDILSYKTLWHFVCCYCYKEHLLMKGDYSYEFKQLYN